MAEKVIAPLGDKQVIIETGKIAKQADGSVTVQMGETIVIVAAVGAVKAKEGLDFFPLTVDYREKAAAEVIRMLAQQDQVEQQYKQRACHQDRLRHREFEDLEVAEVVHWPTPFFRPSNSAELNAGSIRSSSSRGYSPTASVQASSAKAPSFSAGVTGGSGCSVSST